MPSLISTNQACFPPTTPPSFSVPLHAAPNHSSQNIYWNATFKLASESCHLSPSQLPHTPTPHPVLAQPTLTYSPDPYNPLTGLPPPSLPPPQAVRGTLLKPRSHLIPPLLRTLHGSHLPLSKISSPQSGSPNLLNTPLPHLTPRISPSSLQLPHGSACSSHTALRQSTGTASRPPHLLFPWSGHSSPRCPRLLSPPSRFCPNITPYRGLL